MADIDKANPLDGSLISAFPANERGSRSALETLLEVEHDGSGTAATGRHKIPRGTEAERDASTNWNTGSLWISTSVTPNVLQMNVGTQATPSWISSADVTGLADLIDDTTPQLGGDLDLNGKNFDFATVKNIADCLDEDNMASDSPTALATQQSIKAYVDSQDHTGITLGTEQASTSGTSIDFTSIPAGTERITIMFIGFSTSGTSDMMIQLGDIGGVETSGYSGGCSSQSGVVANFTAGFIQVTNQVAAGIYSGSVVLSLEDSANFHWVANGAVARTDATETHVSSGDKALSAELDRVRITTVGGSDTFDAGAINIQYE